MEIGTRAARLDERSTICHLVNLAYDAEAYGPSFANPVKSVGDSHMDPHDRPDNTRVLLAAGEIVCALHILEREAYACSDVVPFGIVTHVATHPAHRRKGYARLLMADAEAYMRRRGFVYGLLMGLVRTYGGRIGWRLASENRLELTPKYVAAARNTSDPAVSTRRATAEDIPFLSRLYRATYSRLFGPVVRSQEFWRRWSLERTWDGTYETVTRGGAPVGYCHVGAGRDSVDEFAWEGADARAAEDTLRGAAALAKQAGVAEVSFWINAPPAALAALHSAFGDVRRVYCAPNGQPALSKDPTAYKQANWPDGVGYMVKYLNHGPGILAEARTTEDLTRAMARHSWFYLDGDGA